MSPRLPVASRFPSQGHLLRTTALVSLLSALAALQPAQAQVLYTLDNATPGSQPLRATTGTWAADSQIWYNQTSGQWETLSAGGVAVLDAKANNANVTLTVQSTDPNTGLPAPIRIDGIQIEQDGYTLTGGTLNGNGAGLVFRTSANGTRTIAVNTALDASVSVTNNVVLNYGGTTTSAASLPASSAGSPKASSNDSCSRTGSTAPTAAAVPEVTAAAMISSLPRNSR